MAKRVAPLTAVQVQNLKAHPHKTLELIDGAVPGLRVRMTPNGAMTWSLNVRDAKGMRRRFDVGAELKLSEARVRAEKLKQAIREGQDPAAAKREARARSKAAANGLGTFDALVRDYFERGPGLNLKTRSEQLARIKSVFREYLDSPALNLTPAQLQIAADKHASASSAAHAIAYLRPIGPWAHRRELLGSGFDQLEAPASLDDEDDAEAGQRVLSRCELSALLPHLSQDGFGAAVRLILWTGCRRGEICGATWSEFDLESAVWTIPAARRKDTRSRRRKKKVPQVDHVVRLPRQAVQLLAALKSQNLGELVVCGPRGANLSNWHRWTRQLWKTSGVNNWDRHALRRCVATLAGDAGAPPHVVSALLGHKNIGDPLTAGYSKARYTIEVGTYLQKIADELDHLGTVEAQVLQFRKTA